MSIKYISNRLKKSDTETFYFDVLRCYMPNIVHNTWSLNSVGVGFFKIQGFERKNKRSNNTFKCFTNKKRNIVKKKMKFLWGIFYQTINCA